MSGQVAHVLNRGVDKRTVFLDEHDYERFLSALYCVNHRPGGLRPNYRRELFVKTKLPEREKLVDILQWTLMPNHFHLLLHERVEGGISEFDRRLTNSYTKYFNIKYQRTGGGYLFQGATKAISFSDQTHFDHVPVYLAMNPLSLHMPGWKEKGIDSPQSAISFIENYRWSSFGAEKNKTPYTFLTDKRIFEDIFGVSHHSLNQTIKEIAQDPQHAMLHATWHVAGEGFHLIALLGIFLF